MLQDIAPYSFCNDFAWISPEPTDRVLVYQGSSVLVSIEAVAQNASEDVGEGAHYAFRHSRCFVVSVL